MKFQQLDLADILDVMAEATGFGNRKFLYQVAIIKFSKRKRFFNFGSQA